MNLTLRVLPLLVVLTSLSCTKEAPPPASPPGTAPVAPVERAGGYSPDTATAPAIVAASEEALKLLQAKESDPSMKLVSVRKAEAQIVAGTNYRLELELTTAKGPKTVQVVVFKGLDGRYQLTSASGL